MDIYPKNPLTLKKLLAKRPNPCTQVFKSQPSTLSSEPLVPSHLLPKANPSTNGNATPQIFHSSFATVIIMTSDSNSSNTNQSSQTMLEEQTPSEEDGDRPLRGEQTEKKIKPNPKDDSNIILCDDEREEITSCDTRSDGSHPHEIPDFFLSPALSLHPVSEPKFDELKLEDAFSSSSSDEESNLMKQAQNCAEKNEGQFIVNGSCLVNSKLKFKCKFNHQFSIAADDIKRKWCQRCEDLLRDYQDFATKYGGRCTNQRFEEYISFSCHKGHSWKLNFKNAKKRWCLDCVKEEKAELKKKCEEERAVRQKREEEEQQKIFEDARRRAAMEDSNNPNFAKKSNPSPQSFVQAQSVVEYFQRMDYEIEKLAQKYSLEFMSRKEFVGDISYQQILQVYKVLIMPEEILQNYMYSLNAEILKSEFRRFAKIIHPDKNKHPQAGVAFQKIYKVYEAALGRIEGAQKN